MIPNDSTDTAVVLSTDESRILTALIKPDSRLEVILPTNATAKELWTTLEICVKGVNYMLGRMARLKPVVGRILLRFEHKPSLYKELGYDTFNDFRFRGVGQSLGLERSWLYEAYNLAKKWPQLDSERFERIGQKRINILDEFADGRGTNAEKLLQKAESTRTVTELREWAETQGEITPGAATPATIHIHTTLETYRRWKDFCSDENIQAVIGKPDHGEILNALMDEFHNEWLIQGAGIIAAEKEKADEAVRHIDISESHAAGA